MSKNNNTQKIVGLGLFTAIVIVLQLMGSFIRFGTFSISLVLVPVVIGAALYGAGAGAWLGFVFGVVVLLSGDAAAFLGVNALGTILTVLVKGTLAGLLSGLVYKALENKNRTLAVAVAAVVCPVVNTGVTLFGIVIAVMLLQDKNASSPIVVTLSGIVIAVSSSQSLNAAAPIPRVPIGIS